jgi:hypothetical protein
MSHKQQPNLQSFSELDFNGYAEGCNSRISLSSLVTVDMIQYWIKVQNNLITQRYLNVKGSAALGTWNIDFGGSDVLAGSVGLNSIISDYMHYKKTISASAFSYTVTNCDIAGWIIDFLKNPNDISNDYVVVTGAGVNAIDDNMGTYDHHTGSVVVWERSFSSRTISEVHSLFYAKRSSACSSYGHVKIYLKVNNVWTEIIDGHGDSTSYILFSNHVTTGWNLVTGVRISHPTAYTESKIHDLSVFEL